MNVRIVMTYAAACLFATSAHAGMSPQPGSDQAITITPVPRFDQRDVEALIEKPNVTFTVDNAQIAVGKSATLTWRVENADSVTISGLGGAVGWSGSRPVSPLSKTTYTLTAQNRNGAVTKAVTVDVTELVLVPDAEGGYRVVPARPAVFDFVAKAPSAAWYSSQKLRFGEEPTGTEGWAKTITSVRAEDNEDYSNVLLMMPDRQNGVVHGTYNVRIPTNGRFAATVGFTKGHGPDDGAKATVIVEVSERRTVFGRSRLRRFGRTITRDGKLDTITVDLKPYANKTTGIRLIVRGLSNSDDGMVLWIAPRIVK